MFLSLTQLLIWTACSSLLRNSALNPRSCKLLPTLIVDEAVVCGDRVLFASDLSVLCCEEGRGPLEVNRKLLAQINLLAHERKTQG